MQKGRRAFTVGIASAAALASPIASAQDGGGGGPAGASCGDILIVFDRSSSMHKCSIMGKTKEQWRARP